MAFSSCLKLETQDSGDKVNDLLEGNWQVEQFKINGTALSLGNGAITISFEPHDNFTKEGKMITKQPGNGDVTEVYEISEDGQTILVSNEINDIFVDDSTLKLWKSSNENEIEVLTEIILFRL